MPSIQAMRSDALAVRAKEDIQEKVPSFFNSVNQALGQSVTQAQDSTQQLMNQRASAANGILANLKKRIEGKQGLAEQGVNNAFKVVQTVVDVLNAALGQMDLTMVKTVTDVIAFGMELAAYKEQFKAVTMDYIQYTVQAGYSGDISFDSDFNSLSVLGIQLSNGAAVKNMFSSMGARGAVTHRDALTPRYTNRRTYKPTGALGNYDTMYNYASVGQLAKVGRYDVQPLP